MSLRPKEPSNGPLADLALLDPTRTASAFRREKHHALALLGASAAAAHSAEAIFHKAQQGLTSLGLASLLLRPSDGQLELFGVALPHGASEAARASLLALRRPWLPSLARAWRTGPAYCPDGPGELACFIRGAEGDRARRTALALGLGHGVLLRIQATGGVEALLVALGDWLAEEDLPAFQLFSRQLSDALDAATGLADLRHRNAELAALNRVAVLAGASHSLQTLFDQGSDELCTLLGCRTVGFFLLEESGQVARLAHLHGGSSEAAAHFQEIRLDSPATLLGQVTSNLELRVWRLGDYPEPTRSVLSRLGLELVASVPLIARSNLVGIMNVGFAEIRDIEPRQLELLRAMGVHLAAAIEPRRLLEELMGNVADLGLLQEVGRSLVSTLEPQEVLDVGVRNLAKCVGATDAYLLLASADGTSLTMSAVAGAHQQFLGRVLPLSPPDSSVASVVFHSRSPLVVEDALNDSRVEPTLRAITGARAYLGLPLVVRDRIIGAVVMLDTQGPKSYSSAEIERATAISNQLAVAVENARLYDDLRASYSQLARAQSQSLERERLAALGELAAVVAHEVRNPLGVIFNSLGSLNRLLRPTGDAQLLLSMVGQEADRLNRIVGDLLDFARPNPPALLPGAMELLLEDALSSVLGAEEVRIEVRREFQPKLPRVPMDARLLRQAFVNLLVNALQAMPGGGTLTVQAKVEMADDGPEVVLGFSDTGVGISPEVRANIFAPFFTTKAAGTGLGLALVKRIVDDHQAKIEVESEVGRGTTFLLRFRPVADSS